MQYMVYPYIPLFLSVPLIYMYSQGMCVTVVCTCSQ